MVALLSNAADAVEGCSGAWVRIEARFAGGDVEIDVVDSGPRIHPDVEKKIIGYLAANYPPQEDRRRAPIPPDLMPPNPYAPSLQGKQ